MRDEERARAIDAARVVLASRGLHGDEAVVLNDSNKLTLRLLPCDVVARIAPVAEQNAAFEVDLASRLAAQGSPVVAPDPRLGAVTYRRDDFMITFWTHHPSGPGTVAAPAYAEALGRLHAGLRSVDVDAPMATERVDEARRLIASRSHSPALPDHDRALLRQTLERLGRSIAAHPREQLLHGEPHPGNVLATPSGAVFVDFETACRGPVEFDLAHAPDEVAAYYPGLDHDLLLDCRTLVLAMIISWRWDPGDQLPDGARLAQEWTGQLRRQLAERPIPD